MCVTSFISTSSTYRPNLHFVLRHHSVGAIDRTMISYEKERSGDETSIDNHDRHDVLAVSPYLGACKLQSSALAEVPVIFWARFYAKFGESGLGTLVSLPQ